MTSTTRRSVRHASSVECNARAASQLAPSQVSREPPAAKGRKSNGTPPKAQVWYKDARFECGVVSARRASISRMAALRSFVPSLFGTFTASEHWYQMSKYLITDPKPPCFSPQAGSCSNRSSITLGRRRAPTERLTTSMKCDRDTAGGATLGRAFRSCFSSEPSSNHMPALTTTVARLSSFSAHLVRSWPHWVPWIDSPFSNAHTRSSCKNRNKPCMLRSRVTSFNGTNQLSHVDMSLSSRVSLLALTVLHTVKTVGGCRWTTTSSG